MMVEFVQNNGEDESKLEQGITAVACENTAYSDLKVSGTFTCDLIVSNLGAMFKKAGMPVKVHAGAYDQLADSVLGDTGSKFDRYAIIVVLIRGEDLIRAEHEAIHHTADDGCFKTANERIDHYLEILKNGANSKKKINVAITPSGTSENKALIFELERRLLDEISLIANVSLIDLRGRPEFVAADKIFDRYLERIAHIPYTEEYCAVLAWQLLRYISGQILRGSKAIAVDCDGTLWRGRCAEVEVEELVVDARCHALQRLLKQRSADGWLIFLCSKNSEDDVLEVFRRNHNMVLSLNDVAGWRIGWDEKSKYLEELAQEFNIDVDSFVFIDDEEIEREKVAVSFPRVVSISPDLPGPRPITDFWIFDVSATTEEDRLRNSYYRAGKIRSEKRKTFDTLESFILDLDIKVTPKDAS